MGSMSLCCGCRVAELAVGFATVGGVSPIVWDTSRFPHALVVGETGSGKTVLATRLIKRALDVGMFVRVLDPKGVDLLVDPADGLQCAQGMGDCADALFETLTELRVRLDQMKETRTSSWSGAPLLMVIDEAAVLFAVRSDADQKAAKALRDRMQSALSEIVLLGRAPAVSVLLVAQRGDTEFIGGGAVRDQFSVRIALGRMSDSGYAMAGFPDTVFPWSCDRGTGWIAVGMGDPEPFRVDIPSSSKSSSFLNLKGKINARIRQQK
jgi:FtsK/SpoIIIE family